jgi:hypothetical protein
VTGFGAFDDDSSVMTVDEMSIENGTEIIAIHGSMNIAKDQHSLKNIKALINVLQQISNCIAEEENLPEKIEITTEEGGETENPFM